MKPEHRILDFPKEAFKSFWVASCGQSQVVRLIGPCVITSLEETELAPRVLVEGKALLEGVNIAPSHQNGTVTKLRLYDAERGSNELFWVEILRGLQPGDTLPDFRITGIE